MPQALGDMGEEKRAMENHSPSMLEQWGLHQITKNILAHEKQPKEPKHILGFGVFLAFVIGLVMTACTAFFEIILLEDDWVLSAPLDLAPLAKFLLVSVILIVIELYLLYQLGFAVAAKWLAFSLDYTGRDPEIIRSLARAVLEMPEPSLVLDDIEYKKDENFLAKLSVLILYKLKAAVTVRLAKYFFQKIATKYLTRSALRMYTALLAAPVTGFWDAIIFYRTMCEVKHRISGRIAVMAIGKILQENEDFRYYFMNDQAIFLKERISAWGEYDVNLHYLLAQTQSLSSLTTPGSLATTNLDDQVVRAAQATNQKLATILLALKRTKLNRHEKVLLEKVALTVEAINQVKPIFHRMSKNEILEAIDRVIPPADFVGGSEKVKGSIRIVDNLVS